MQKKNANFHGMKISLGVINGGDLADTAIRALEGGALSYNGNPSKSTLIIHSVQRVSTYIQCACVCVRTMYIETAFN